MVTRPAPASVAAPTAGLIIGSASSVWQPGSWPVTQFAPGLVEVTVLMRLPPACQPVAGGWNTDPVPTGFQALDALGLRYINLQQCGWYEAALTDHATSTIAGGPANWQTNTNASNTPATGGPTCGPAVGNWAKDPVPTGTQVLDLLDQTRGAGYVQFQMVAPGSCPAAASTSTQSATLSATGLSTVTSTGNVTVNANCSLQINKTSNPATGPVKSGDVVTYTITVTNPGNLSYTGATFTDDMSGVLNNATLTGGPTATSGQVSMSGTTLTWTGDVPAGGTVTVTYQVTVN